jgi:hypothetical protein
MPIVRRRRPLLRTAAIGGGAYMMGKSAAKTRTREASQEARLQELESQQAAAPVAAPVAAPQAATGGISEASLQRLQELAKLHEQGILTDEEFADQKQRVLSA